MLYCFFKGEEQTSNYGKKTHFEFNESSFFIGFGEIGPDESMSINPQIISDATEDMYVFIRVVIREYNGVGLYEMDMVYRLKSIESENIGLKHLTCLKHLTLKVGNIKETMGNDESL